MRLYHRSNKLLLPLIIPSLIIDDNNYKKYFDFLNITNLSFHSYVSFSSIITDYYKKIPYLNKNILKLINFKSHSIIFLFFSYKLYEKSYNNNEYKYFYLKRQETLPDNLK
jgi:hypothetical protein